MNPFPRYRILQAMASSGLVPLHYTADPEEACRVISACHEGGARVFEFTNRGRNALDVFAVARRHVDAHCPELHLGVGSVIDGPTAALYVQAGADFVVSPSLQADVARLCNRRKILWIPGCGSMTEITAAEELGAELVKLFPASVLGPRFVEAVRGPSPWTCIMPTGGVSADRQNLASWFQAGATCVGMGSQLISGELVRTGDFGGLADRVRAVLALIAEVRG